MYIAYKVTLILMAMLLILSTFIIIRSIILTFKYQSKSLVITPIEVSIFALTLLVIIANVKLVNPTTQTEKSAERIIDSLYTSSIYNMQPLRSELQKVFERTGFYTIDPENIFNISQRHLKWTSSNDTKIDILYTTRDSNHVSVVFDIKYKDRTQRRLAIFEVKGDKFANFQEYIISESVNYN